MRLGKGGFDFLLCMYRICEGICAVVQCLFSYIPPAKKLGCSFRLLGVNFL